jgi:hypothetical protein
MIGKGRYIKGENMNAKRRKEITKAQALIEEAKGILETCQSDEQEYYDNMPENMQSGEKGQNAENAAGALQSAVENLEEAVSNCDTSLE